MNKFIHLVKYSFILIILQNLIIYANASKIDDIFYKLGYIEKERFSISLSYSNYSNNNNFIIKDILQTNLSHKDYDIKINNNYIKKNYNGVYTKFGVQVIPPLKAFISYNYKLSKTNIHYTIPAKYFVALIKDYSDVATIKDEEHTFMSGLEFIYEYQYKNFVPYINIISAFGVTASTNYDNIFYSMNIALNIGLLYKINQNLEINGYAGVDYSSLYNSSYINDKVIANIPEDYFLLGLPQQNLQLEFIYEERYSDNINMALGIEATFFKHYNIFIETKYINNFFLNIGLKYKW